MSVSPLRTIPPHITSTLSRPDLVLVSTDSIVNILGLYKAFWYTGSAFTRYFNHNNHNNNNNIVLNKYKYIYIYIYIYIYVLELSVVNNTQHHFWLQGTVKKIAMVLDLQHAAFSVDLVTIEVGCLSHFMPVTVTNLSNVCHLPKKQYIAYFSRQLVLPSPVHTGYLMLGLQHHGM